MRWPLQPLKPLQKTQLQPPFGPSVDSPCHPWVTTTNPSYRFPIFETSATALCGTTGITTKTQTWPYRDFSKQTVWLRHALLVKRIPCLVSQSESLGRQRAMTLQEKDSADTQKAVCENMPLPFPATVLCKKDPTRKKPTWLYRGFADHERTEWLRITR